MIRSITPPAEHNFEPGRIPLFHGWRRKASIILDFTSIIRHPSAHYLSLWYNYYWSFVSSWTFLCIRILHFDTFHTALAKLRNSWLWQILGSSMPRLALEIVAHQIISRNWQMCLKSLLIALKVVFLIEGHVTPRNLKLNYIIQYQCVWKMSTDRFDPLRGRLC